jgi:hypothetical protein
MGPLPTVHVHGSGVTLELTINQGRQTAHQDQELSCASALSGSAALTCAPRHLRDYDSDLMVGIWMHRWESRGVKGSPFKGSPFKSGRPDWVDADCDQHVGI